MPELVLYGIRLLATSWKYFITVILSTNESRALLGLDQWEWRRLSLLQLWRWSSPRWRLLRHPLQPPVPSLYFRQPWKPSLNILAALGSDLGSGQADRPSSGWILRYCFTTELLRSKTSVSYDKIIYTSIYTHQFQLKNKHKLWSSINTIHLPWPSRWESPPWSRAGRGRRGWGWWPEGRAGTRRQQTSLMALQLNTTGEKRTQWIIYLVYHIIIDMTAHTM